MAGEDFINVKLSAAGVKYAGRGGQVAVHNSRREFTFKAGEAQRVLLAYEWSAVLGPMRTPAGEPMFEIVPEAATPASATPAKEGTDGHI